MSEHQLRDVGDIERENWFHRVEAPTWIMIAIAYCVWALGISLFPYFGVAPLVLISAVAATLHASLQHEALHGHPTKNAALNEALVFFPLSLAFPYRRFKEAHLKHHCDERLTDPYDDPETWYVAERDHQDFSLGMRLALRFNATFFGRLLIGPWLSAFGLYRADFRCALKEPNRRLKIADAYGRHAIAAAATLYAAHAIGGVDPLTYALCVAWPAVSLLMIRTYVEHRAEEDASHRTAIVDAEPFFALLFLNNNLHAVHHARPREAWYRLPAIWRREQKEVLEKNGGYYVPGYFSALRTWFFTARLDVEHPFVGRTSPLEQRAAAPVNETENQPLRVEA